MVKQDIFFHGHDIRGLTMHNNKTTFNKIAVCKTRRNIILFLAVFIVFALVASSDSLAAGKVKAYGILTSIEDDGTVIIDEKGYLVSSSVTVQDYQGDRIFLKDLLPSRYVHFEFEQTTRGFEILFIKEIPQ